MARIAIILCLISLTNVRSHSLHRRDTPRQFLEIEQKIAQESFECGKQLGLKVLDMKLPKEFGIFDDEDHAITNEFWGCIWYRMDLITKDSVVNEENVANYYSEMLTLLKPPTTLNRETINYFVQQCKQLKSKNYGQMAIKVQNCMETRLHVYVMLERLFSIKMG
uniref:Uncharacterized protein n=1 Tax=Photinus pyralis TaxID=7054 RepID=A0A1Y1L2J0_PHOPY